MAAEAGESSSRLQARGARTLLVAGGSCGPPPEAAATCVLAVDAPWPAPAETFDSIRASLPAWNSLTQRRRLDLWERLRLGGEVLLGAGPEDSGAEPVPPPRHESADGFSRPEGASAAPWRAVKLTAGSLELAGLRGSVRDLLAVPSRLRPHFEDPWPPEEGPARIRLLGRLGDRDEWLYHPLFLAACAPRPSLPLSTPARLFERPGRAFDGLEWFHRLVHLRHQTGALLDRLDAERWVSPVRLADETLCSLAYFLRSAAEEESALLLRLQPHGP